MTPLLLPWLAGCETELPFEPTSVCDEIRWALSARVLECTEDGDLAAAVSDDLDRDVPCAVTGFTPAATVHPAVLTTARGEDVPLEEAFACAQTASELACGETEAGLLWEALVAAAPACSPLREAGRLDTCEALAGGHQLCRDPLPWAEAARNCELSGLVLWSSEPDQLPPEASSLASVWLGVSMRTCADPFACAEFWTLESGGYLWAPDSRPWAEGEPEPTVLGSALYVTVEDVVTYIRDVRWFAAPPTEAHAYFCEAAP